MVRGLAIRRFFIFVDLALAVAVVAVGSVLAMRVLHPPETGVEEENAQRPALGGGAMRLPEVGPLASYDVITKNGLFGDAGRFDPTKAPAPPKPVIQEDVPETDLNLRLMGTIALSAKDPFGSAFIQNLDRNKGRSESFLLGEDVIENVTLEEIHKRQVILLNKRKTPPLQERLSMDEEDDSKVVASAPPRPTSGRSSQRIQISKAEIQEELSTNFKELLKIKPVIKRDARGNVTGLSADNIGQYELAKKLGLEDGDVLQTVNNEKIDSQAKIMELIQKHQNASSFRIGILRNGKPRIMTYNLR